MKQEATSIIDSILGCILGGAIGDAAGATFEGRPRDSMLPALDAISWHLTDDTQLTLATCEALVESERPDPALIAASFLRWYRSRRLTGLGASTLKALMDLDVGAHWALAGRRGERAAGNGAAMRIAPMAFCLDPLADDSRRLIRDVCRITHHSDEAYVGAFAVTLAVWAAKEGRYSLDWIISNLPDTSVRERLQVFSSLPRMEELSALADRYGSSGYVVESVPLALLAATKVAELGFAGMLEQVIAAGGDTDTNSSIAGQIAGAARGLGGLPSELLAKLPQVKMVMGIARTFAECLASRSTLPSREVGKDEEKRHEQD